MKNELTYFLSFIKAILEDWFNFILFLPTLYGLIQYYLPQHLQILLLTPSQTIYFLFIAFFLAIYRTWRKEHKTLTFLLSKTAKYTFKSKVAKLTASQEIIKINEEISSLEKELPVLPNPIIQTPFLQDKTQQSVINYIQELNDYRDELTKIFQKEKIICFSLDIASDKYDENVSVFCNFDGATVVDSLFDLGIPLRPTYQSSLAFLPSSNFSIDTSRTYRTNIEVSEMSASCDLSYIKPGQPVSFFNDYLFLISNRDKVHVQVKVVSKNSGGEQLFDTEFVTAQLEGIIDTLEFQE